MIRRPQETEGAMTWEEGHTVEQKVPPRHRPDRTGHNGGRRRRRLESPSKYAIASTALLWLQAVSAVSLPFDNCLPDNYIYSNQAAGEAQLQWVPLHLEAVFDLNSPNHNLRVTVWGNVTGKVGSDPLPAWNDSAWSDPKGVPLGKILAQSAPNTPNSNATTLHTKVDVATYEPFTSDVYFCDNLLNGPCPLGPVFNTTPINFPYDLPSFNFSNDFYSSYAFASFAPTFIIFYGDEAGTTIGCVSTTATPSLGGLAWFLKFLPLLVLFLVGSATVFAAVFSPWGTGDVFHWTSNYGRDPDLLRLVTPGFGDCLQYIQYIALTGGLSLDYPGFYQPVASNGAWSALMFNESFVTKSEPWPGLFDGLYLTNGTYGMQNLAQLVGMAQVEDIWAGTMIWLLVIIAAVLFVIQVGFFSRWVLRHIRHTTEEDLRAKNLPFTVGQVIRLVFNYFLLPIVSVSTFQLVVASQSSTVLVVMATLTILLILGFAVWLMYLIATTRPRQHLFDDLPTVLLYGPLYNTYSDEAAPFALIPIILTFIRGIAIGAVQPSGIAQIAILGVCEVIQMLTLHAFRPFHSPTSMNAYHTGFAAFRFITVIPMVAFAPTMGVTEGPKAWIGYTILLLHGGVLVFGFFLNALQTIIEVTARMCGAGGDDVRGQTRGGLSKIFGARQLQRRVSRRGAASRQSQLSTSGMLDADNASKNGYGRVRSESAGSMGILLNNQHRSSSALDGRSLDAYSIPLGGGNFTPTTPGEASTFSFLPSPGQATRPQPTADPYYRPPRARRQTGEDFGPASADFHRGSLASMDLPSKRASQGGGFFDSVDLEGGLSGRGTPSLALAPTAAAAVAAAAALPPQAPYAPVFAPRADYSTREVDFYYGVRGPALNSDAPGRRLGTGPADPTSPVVTATGWLKGIFGGKTKEKGKGFEVVRSARMPPAMRARGGEFSDDAPPEGIPVALGVLRNGPIESDDEDTPKVKREQQTTDESPSPPAHSDDTGESGADDGSDQETHQVAANPPLLPDLDAGESFKFPSRVQSTKTDRQHSVRTAPGVVIGPVPGVPRKSSKRHSVLDTVDVRPAFHLVPPSEASSTPTLLNAPVAHAAAPARLPFDRTNSQKRLSGSSAAMTDDYSQLPSAGLSDHSGDERPTSYGYVHQHNISRVDPSSDQRVDLLGTAAEVMDGSKSPNSSISGRS